MFYMPSAPPTVAAMSDSRTTPTDLLPAGLTTALRSWLAEQLRAQESVWNTPAGSVRARETHQTMSRLCEEARERGVQIEQVVVLLKHLWSTLPLDATPDVRLGSREVFDGIVRVCIEEYYAPTSAAADRSGAARSTDGARQEP